jgi:PAS domain S-box-containing protein
MPVELRVLLLEDNQYDARLVTAALEEAGYVPAVTRANTEAEFRAALSPEIDIILADYSMPQFGAMEALPLLNKSGLDVPLIIVSGSIGEDLAVQALHQGAADYLLKDRLGRLAQAIARALEQRRLREAHRQTEQQLRHSQHILESVLNNVPIGVFWKDWHSRYLGCNRTVCEAFGFDSPEEIIGRTDHDLPALKREEADFFIRKDREVMDCERGERGIIEPATLADGRNIWMETSKVPLHDDGGNVIGVLGVWQDITDRLRLEEQVRQSMKMEAIGRLAGGIAHDFNNLLTVINGYSDLLVGQLPEGDPRRDLVVQIRKAGQRAGGLTRQLLAFSRKTVLVPAVIDLNALLVDMEKLLGPMLGEDVDLRLHPGSNLWRVKVDPGEMGQVVMNLCVNARDAMRQGGKITIETANVELGADYVVAHPDATAGAHVMLAVSDNGCGMDAATRARIFEPFFTTKGPEKGTGLGLAMVYGIVKQSGGHIEVYSEPGLGSTFKIYLPRERSGAPLTKSFHGQRPPVPSGTETILLTEDEEGVRKLTRLVLERSGYTVHEACDGEEALRIGERDGATMQLLITDVVMPNMSGPQLAERLRRLRPGLKVLYLSGYTDDAVVRHGILEGEAPFLQKPFSPDALAHKVREVLDA